MTTQNLTAIHKRGMTVLAIATAFMQVPAGSAAARHADPRDFQATYQVQLRWTGVLPTTTCADVVNAASEERGCSTGGPAGGLIARN